MYTICISVCVFFTFYFPQVKQLNLVYCSSALILTKFFTKLYRYTPLDIGHSPSSGQEYNARHIGLSQTSQCLGPAYVLMSMLWSLVCAVAVFIFHLTIEHQLGSDWLL